MSLTAAQQVFGAIHEDALNDIVRAVLTTRPRYTLFGSPAFVPATTVAATQVAPIPFPGIAGGIEWRVAFDIPVIDLFRQDAPLPPQLTLGPGQFSLSTNVQICLNCAQAVEQPNPDLQENPQLACAALSVYGIGHLDSFNAASGAGEVTMHLDAVELVDVTPNGLESVFECLILQVLTAALAQVRLPIPVLRAGAFQLLVADGPDIDDDQIKVFGTL